MHGSHLYTFFAQFDCCKPTPMHLLPLHGPHFQANTVWRNEVHGAGGAPMRHIGVGRFGAIEACTDLNLEPV